MEDLFTTCAEELAATPELVRQILADHMSNGHGWCRAHEAYRQRHPCSIRQLAELAVELSLRPPSAGLAVVRCP